MKQAKNKHEIVLYYKDRVSSKLVTRESKKQSTQQKHVQASPAPQKPKISRLTFSTKPNPLHKK